MTKDIMATTKIAIAAMIDILSVRIPPIIPTVTILQYQ